MCPQIQPIEVIAYNESLLYTVIQKYNELRVATLACIQKLGYPPQQEHCYRVLPGGSL